jgi:hypothetical protein
MRNTLRLFVMGLALLTVSSGRMTAQQGIPNPDTYFGFKIGADGELARYPKILEYFQLLAKQTDRVKYEELGKTTMGNSYPLLRISSPENLAKFDRLVEINRRLADPRGLSEAEAEKLAAEASRSISSTPRFTRPKSATARRSSTSSTAWRPPPMRRPARSSTTASS